MKIKETFVLRNLAGSNVVVPIGGDMVDFNGMITLNESGAFLWEQLKSGKTKEELVAALMTEYAGVDEATAAGDIDAFIEILEKHGILENE